jgi:hypothetical protein
MGEAHLDEREIHLTRTQSPAVTDIEARQSP